MPIAEIIHEIDACLSRLRQARELLSGRFTEVPEKKLPPRRKKNTVARRTDPTLSTKRQAAGNKLLSNRSIPHPKRQGSLGEPAVQVSSVAPPQTANTEQSAIVQPERTIPQTVAITRLPASRRTSSVRSVPHRSAASRTSPEPTKPAIALSGPTNARIVVVSAEQVQRERERTAQPVVRRPRMATSGLTGKLAFEALFEDPTDPSKSSRQ
jgi:hypothetical protein